VPERSGRIGQPIRPLFLLRKDGMACAMRLLGLLPLALVAACGPAENDPGPGGVTVGEAKALDEAAEMLEQRRLPPEASPSASPSATTSAEGPAR